MIAEAGTNQSDRFLILKKDIAMHMFFKLSRLDIQAWLEAPT